MKITMELLTLVMVLHVGCLNTTALAVPQSEEMETAPARTIEGKIVAILIMTLYEENAFPEGVADEYYFVKDSTGAEVVLHAPLPPDTTGRFIIGDRIQAHVSVYGEVLSLHHTK